MRYDPETGTIALTVGPRVTLKDGKTMDRGAFLDTFMRVASLSDEMLCKIRDYLEKPKKHTNGSARTIGGNVSRSELQKRENGTVVLTPQEREILRNRGVMDDNSTLFHVAQMFVQEMAGRGLDSGKTITVRDLLRQTAPALTPVG